MTDRYYDEKLLAEWAKGRKTRIPAPLSVRSRWYRRLIFQIAQTALLGPGGRILSIGAGTGKTECYLQSMGFDVIASDVDETALRLCREAGLVVRYFDITSPVAENLLIDLVYVDGVLGHLQEHIDWQGLWTGLASTGGAFLLMSNDLSDDDASPNFHVHGEPEARFLRPPAGFFEASASQTGYWQTCWSHVLKYRRPGRGLRRRELVLLSRATGGQTDGRSTHS
jgi:SAM-dependent methyltransferase